MWTIPPPNTDLQVFYETHPADRNWVDEELIPFLESSYGKRRLGFWADIVASTTLQLADHEVHEDFPSTVERFRLLMVNPEILTSAEMKDFGFFRDHRNTFRICIGVFVRHNIHHGWYKLYSLGKEPDPDHPRLKDTTYIQDTYIFGGKLQFSRTESTKSAGRSGTREPSPGVQPPLGQSFKGQSIPISSSEEPASEGDSASVSHRPSNLLNESVDPKNSGETSARIEKWLHVPPHVLPRRPSNPPSEEVFREALRKISFHSRRKAHSRPEHVLRRLAGQTNSPRQINNPPRSHAGGPRKRKHQGNAPRNDQGTPSAGRPRVVAPSERSPALPPSRPTQRSPAMLPPRPPVDLTNSYIYQGLAHPGGGYTVPQAPYPNFAQPPGTHGSYYGHNMQYPPPGYYAPVPQVHGGYQAQYPPPGTFAPVQQGQGSFYPRQAYLPVNKSSSLPFQGAIPAPEPSAHNNHLRMDANDFVQGANGNGV